MGSFLEFVGVALVIAFVWVVCGMWWGILALAVVLIIVGNAIDREATHDDPAQAGKRPGDGA
jgi:ABC-type antimicrobial peptide transport system permease subunit